MSSSTPYDCSPSITILRTQLDKRISAFAESLGVETAKVKEILRNECGIDDENEKVLQRSLEILDNEDMLTFGDLAKHFVSTGLAKTPVLRLSIKHLRGKESAESMSTKASETTEISLIKEMITANRPKSEWSDEELLEKYSREETDVIKILSDRTKGRPCIAFVPGTDQINKEISLKLVRIAKRQPTHEKFEVNGILFKVYRAGLFPAQLLDESPFDIGVALVDGFCGKTGTNWNGVSQECRVLARILFHNVENGKLNNRDMKAICKESKSGAKDFRTLYPEAAMTYDELQTQDKLPKLRIAANADLKVDRGV